MATPFQNLQFLKSTPHLSSFSVISTSFIPKKAIINSNIAIRPKCPATLKTACMVHNVNPLRNRPEYIPNNISDPSYVRILDTTLRDGEQTPGVNFSSDQKLQIAVQLARLSVDVIEAGFPASSPLAGEVVKHIAATVGNGIEDGGGHVPVINAVARCLKADIDVAWEAVRDASKPRMTIFIATSEIHMRHKLRKSKSEVLKIVKDALSYTRSLGSNDVAFCAEDSSRTEKEFLYKVFEEAIEAGATTLIMADTVGCMFPNVWARFIADVRKNVRGIEHVVLSTHCHNDLGLSTANTLAALEAGVRQVEGTMNGIGERAGNVALEEVIMAIKYRGKDLLGGLRTGIDTNFLASTSQMVEEYSGFTLQPNKCIVGANIFRHASGIHQDGVLKHRGTYEILSPEDIGKCSSLDLGIILGKYSGRHALQSKLRQLGYEVDDTHFEILFSRFKEMAHNKKHISDGDLKSLM